jgi:hypothetical protein
MPVGIANNWLRTIIDNLRISFTLSCTASVIAWIVKTGFTTLISRKLLSMMPLYISHFKMLSRSMRLGTANSPSERLSCDLDVSERMV